MITVFCLSISLFGQTVTRLTQDSKQEKQDASDRALAKFYMGLPRDLAFSGDQDKAALEKQLNKQPAALRKKVKERFDELWPAEEKRWMKAGANRTLMDDKRNELLENVMKEVLPPPK